MQEELPLISILIPVYNTGKYLKRCAKSLVRQTYPNLEIIFLNDGSTDDSKKILDEIKLTDSRIKVYEKANEKSLSKTRNALLEKISGKYFIFVDSDDYVCPNYVSELYNHLVFYDADIAVCSFRLQFFEMPIAARKEHRVMIYSGKEAITEMILGKELRFMLWNKIFKTELLQDVRFEPSVCYGEDLVFCVRYFRKCSKIAYFNKPLYHYMNRLSSEMHQKLNAKYLTLLDGLQELLNEETDADVETTLRAWIGLTSCMYLILDIDAHYLSQEQKDMLCENVIKYNNELKKTKKKRKLYQSIYTMVDKIVQKKYPENDA